MIRIRSVSVESPVAFLVENAREPVELPDPLAANPLMAANFHELFPAENTREPPEPTEVPVEETSKSVFDAVLIFAVVWSAPRIIVFAPPEAGAIPIPTLPPK